jgi:hypothetical protein
MILERLDVVIGDGRDDNNFRWDGTRLSVSVLDVIPLTRIWFRDRPIKRIEAAVDRLTKPGSRFFLITYSC